MHVQGSLARAVGGHRPAYDTLPARVITDQQETQVWQGRVSQLAARTEMVKRLLPARRPCRGWL